MASKKKSSVINMTHQSEDEDNANTSGESSAAADIMKAVREELQRNRATLIEEVQQPSLPAVEAAVKRAMEGATSSNTGTRKRRKTHIFKNAENKRRFEDTEDIIDKVEEATEKIGVRKLEAAKTAPLCAPRALRAGGGATRAQGEAPTRRQ